MKMIRRIENILPFHPSHYVCLYVKARKSIHFRLERAEENGSNGMSVC